MNRSPDNSIVREWGKYRQPQRSPRVPVWVLVMLLVASGLGALAITVWLAVRPHPWRPPSGSPAFVSCTYGGRISAWCARIAVPEDPQRPDGRSISLRIAVLPATTRPAAGALFYLEGGPGGAASQSAVLVNPLFAQVERNRDIVMVDERGTGGSNRLTCPGLTPQGSADAVAAYVRRCFAGLRACTRLASPPTISRRYGRRSATGRSTSSAPRTVRRSRRSTCTSSPRRSAPPFSAAPR